MEKTPYHHVIKWERWISRTKNSVPGVIVALAFGAWGASQLDKSGTLREYDPIAQGNPDIDNEARIISWNMHNETESKIKSLKKIIKKEHPDAIALQEVNSSDAYKLHQTFNKWYIRYALADSRQEFQDGGYGNVLMTTQMPKEVKIKPIDGSSYVETAGNVIAGTVKDSSRFVTNIIKEDSAQACQENSQKASLSEETAACTEGKPIFSDAAAGWQEQRAAEALTIKIRVGDELEDMRIITGHISGNQSIHDKQLNEWMGFIKDNTKKESTTVVCGDFNTEPEKIIPKAAGELGYYIPTTDSTSSTHNATIDYCGFYNGKFEGLGKTQVLKKFKTDHHPIIGSIALNSSE